MAAEGPIIIDLDPEFASGMSSTPENLARTLSDLKIAGQVIDLKSIPDVVQWTEINGVAMTAIDSYTAPDQVKTPSTQ